MLLPFPPDCKGLHPSLSVTSLSLSSPLSIPSSPSVLRASSLYGFTQRSIVRSSIFQCFLSLPLEPPADIYSCVQMAANLPRGHYESRPGPWPSATLPPRLLVRLRKRGSSTSHSSKFSDIWCFLAKAALLSLPPESKSIQLVEKRQEQKLSWFRVTLYA